MIAITDFKTEHLSYLLKTGITDKKLAQFWTPERGPVLEKFGGTFTLLEDEKPVAIGGILQYWPTRGEAWLLIGKPSIQRFPSIVKMIKKFITKCPLQRIEMVIAHDWQEGPRWAKLLGFKKEADTLEKYLPDGRDVSLYARVRA